MTYSELVRRNWKKPRDIHKYFGLIIDFSGKNQGIFTMYDYIEDIFDIISPLNMNGAAPDS